MQFNECICAALAGLEEDIARYTRRWLASLPEISRQGALKEENKNKLDINQDGFILLQYLALFVVERSDYCRRCDSKPFV